MSSDDRDRDTDITRDCECVVHPLPLPTEPIPDSADRRWESGVSIKVWRTVHQVLDLRTDVDLDTAYHALFVSPIDVRVTGDVVAGKKRTC